MNNSQKYQGKTVEQILTEELPVAIEKYIRLYKSIAEKSFEDLTEEERVFADEQQRIRWETAKFGHDLVYQAQAD